MTREHAHPLDPARCACGILWRASLPPLSLQYRHDNIDNLLLEMLKGLRNEVQTLRTEMHTQFGDLKARMLTIERGIGGTKRDAAACAHAAATG